MRTRGRSTVRGLMATVAALTLITAACGSGDGTETGSDGGQVSSPIAEYLGMPDFSGDPADAQAQAVAQERARQQAIAACMKEQGFEYVPMDPSENMFFGGEEGLEPGSDEWVAKYGFGITTMRFSQEQVGPDLIGHTYDEMFSPDDDPNHAILEAMSESERRAYQEALYGGDDFGPQFDESLTEEEMEAQFEELGPEAFMPGGCEGESMANDPSQAFYFEFNDELDDMWKRIQNDPRIVAAEEEIGRCVADKGHQYDGMENLYQQFESDLNQIETELWGGDFGPDISEDELASMSEAELEVAFQPPELSDESRALLADLQAEELALAQAVNECGGGFAGQEELYNEVRVEYEQEFLDTHADRLADLKAGG